MFGTPQPHKALDLKNPQNSFPGRRVRPQVETGGGTRVLFYNSFSYKLYLK